MKKYLPLALSLLMVLTACARAEALTGRAQGYGGELVVSVTMDGDSIVGVEIVSHNETQNVAGTALQQIPQEILAKNSTNVDVVSGATYTSRAIMEAVANAINPGQNPEAVPSAQPSPSMSATTDLYTGFGVSTLGRIGPGKDADGIPVYSFNEVFATALFDMDGRIVDIYIDQLEVATPNYDGANMPIFGGFPGQGGYNWDQNHDGKIEGKTPDTEDEFLAEIAAWKTKRQRGDTYKMTTGTWASQMDAFERVFVGKTVDEIDAWFKGFCSDRNGRPLKADSTDAQDKEKYDKLSDADKTMLADVTTAATMSLNDAHGNILAAIRSAYDNRTPVGGENNAVMPINTLAPMGAASPLPTIVAPTATPASTQSNG